MSVYTVTDVLNEARVILNDTTIQIYTDALLLPVFQIAFTELIRKIQNNGLGLTFEQTVALSVAANATTISLAAFPNFISPLELHEKNPGDPDNMYQPMDRREWIPDIPSSTFIGYWCWRQQTIFILPPLQARQVRIRYETDRTTLALGDPVPINNGQTFLSQRTAAIAAFSIGSNPSKANVFNEEAEERKDEVIRHGVNDKQNLPARRRSFSIYRASRYR